MDLQKAKSRVEEERERLVGVRERLHAELQQDQAGGEDVGELSSVDQHPADQATETFEREKDLSLIESIDEQIADADAALQRIEEGTYGICERCGRPIGEDRLEALPAARLCIEDQTAVQEELSARSGRV